ncbi:MAG TPA: glutathione peroxidase, partial [Thermotogota bacterium]|nr:glutathione peroxidase [Thermotogota bacterium]
MGFYDYSARKMNGREVKMETYKGKVVIVVNTASKCGFTPQFAELETLYKKYKDQGLAILGFPCNQFANQDPASNQEIQNFCQLNYGVSFDMFEKVDVNGPETTPLYQFLKEEAKGAFGGKIKWNFTKFLIDRKQEVIRRYAPATPPLKMEEEI